MPRLFTLLVVLFSSALSNASSLLESKRILFLGDSITHSGIHLANLETYLSLAHPDPERVMMNLGLPSETVSGLSEENHAEGRFPRPVLSERITRVLNATKPDLIVACYGINDGIYSPFDPVRYRKFREGIIQLRNAAARHGAHITFLTPWPYDHKKGNESWPADYNSAVLGVYSKWLLDQRQFGWQVLDTHGALTKFLTEKRKTEPDYALARDGVHFNANGDWQATRVLLNFLGGGNPATLEEMLAPYPDGKKVHQEITEKMKKSRNEWLTKTKHKRPGTPGGPK